MSAKVTVKVPMIKGMIQIHVSDSNPRMFLASAANYIPVELAAESLGTALDKVLQNLHMLQRTPEAIARGKIAAESARKTREATKIAEAAANAKQSNQSKKQEGNKVA